MTKKLPDANRPEDDGVIGIAPAVDADEHLRETPLSSDWILRGNFLQVKRDRVALPDGREATREYIRHPGAAVIVPLFDDGRVTDAKTLICLQWLQRWRAGAWPLDWMPADEASSR